MDIVEASFEIVRIFDRMFPKSVLPYASLSMPDSILGESSFNSSRRKIGHCEALLDLSPTNGVVAVAGWE